QLSLRCCLLCPYTTLFRSESVARALIVCAPAVGVHDSSYLPLVELNVAVWNAPPSMETWTDAMPLASDAETWIVVAVQDREAPLDRKSTRLNSSHEWISYA